MQKELPPSSSAWRWQTLKFITAVVYCAEGGWGGAVLERNNENGNSGERGSENLPKKKVDHTRVEKSQFVFVLATEQIVLRVHLFYVAKEGGSVSALLRLPVPELVSAAA